MDYISERTPPVIAAEINFIRHQTGQLLLKAAIEIGRRLKEAKDLLPHGEWGQWLEESVNYSQRTATNLMRIYDAYGEASLQSSSSPGVAGQIPQLPNLNYSQALLLLGIPESERAQFIEELDVENMSIRELQKAIQERNQALKERDQALQKKAEVQKSLEAQITKVSQISGERDSIRAKAEELKRSHTELESKTIRLHSELNSLKQSTEHDALQRMSKNLKSAYNKARANKVAFLYENLDRTFKELVWELGELAAQSPEVYEDYKEKLIDFLAKGLKQKYNWTVIVIQKQG